MTHSHSLSRPPLRTRQFGFTLIELLITIVIVAVMAMIATPSFSKLLKSWQRDSAIRTFTGHVQQARSESIKSSRPVLMCISADAATCAADTIKDWKSGWLVYVDRDRTGSFDATKDLLVVARSGFSGLTSMEAKTTASPSADVKTLTFLPSGLMANPETVFTALPNSSAVDTFQITINRVGRATVAKKP